MDRMINDQQCGQSTQNRPERCPHCGTLLPRSQKNWNMTMLLCLFLGYFGVHRFYTGRIVSGIFQLLTLGAFGYWTLVDFIIIMLGRFKDGDGNPIINRNAKYPGKIA